MESPKLDTSKPHARNSELLKQLIDVLGPEFKFDEIPESQIEDPKEFVLDPLELDRTTAIQKAIKEGKSIANPATKTGTNKAHSAEPALIPSKSEKLSADDYNTLMMRTFPEYEDMKPGDVSKEGALFVAWDLVKGYPSRYIGKTNRPKALPFFDAMTEEQTWDFFYVYDPRALDRPPYIFVPTEQFEHFLDVVNASIQTKLTIPPGQPSEKFYVSFGSSCVVRPKYLGRSSSNNEYISLQGAIPLPEEEDAGEDITVHGLEMLMSNFTAHVEKKSKSKNKKKKQDSSKKRHESNYDAQLYLGLRPLPGIASGNKAKEFLVDQAVPHALEKNPVFMCIDIEVAEEHHGTILEVGISTLDTNDIVGVPPGDIGRNWFNKIKSRHLITRDFKHMRNKKFIRGCPELFDFGESEYPKKSELREQVLSAFKDFSVAGIPEGEDHSRNIVLVGHDLDSDLGYLASMDVHPWSLNGMFRCLDTKDMHQAWREGEQGRALHYVLGDLDIPNKNLHNAGNDAAYTLRAMLGLAVRSRLTEQENAKKIVEAPNE
ncbi:qde-2-interacting protein [Colletotrichum sojae]|uniref:Qde-2-interacting protein n=1 Tax=Colletotrichum sojae TaxID=2175907 RepID=A0A8H6JWV4_9PEZI|nr:qde-2-interacting protein [Colletotrichum sojae]